MYDPYVWVKLGHTYIRVTWVNHGSYIVNRWSTMCHLSKPWDIWVNHGSAICHVGQPLVNHESFGSTMGQTWANHGSDGSAMGRPWVTLVKRSILLAIAVLGYSGPNPWANMGQSWVKWVIQNGPYKGPVPCPKLNFSLKLQ